MKNSIIYLISLCFLSLFLFSCEDVIDVNLEQGPALLAVDGVINNREGATVRLNLTSPYLNNDRLPLVDNATVELIDDRGNKQSLYQPSPGVYRTVDYKAEVGHSYTLHILYNGEEYQARTEVKRVPPVDSLTYRLEKDRLGRDDGIYVFYYGPEFPGVGDFVRVKVFRNDELLNKTANLIIFTDRLVDGNYLADLELNFNKAFEIGDKVRCEVLSLTEDAYFFYQELSTQVNNQGIFANAPSNIRTNVLNVNPNSGKKAVGYFIGSAISSKEGVVEGQKGTIR